MRRFKLCIDLDETLIPNAYTYHLPEWRCGAIICEALGYNSPPPMDVLAKQYKEDIALIQQRGFQDDRFPMSWVKTYQYFAKQAGVPARREVCDNLFNTANRFKYGPFRSFYGVKSDLEALRRMGHELHLVTVGDEDLQKKKIVSSGLGKFFDSVHIPLRDKHEVLASIVGDRPDLGVMVGDSKRSDMVPAVKLGMIAVWIPSNAWSYSEANVTPHYEIPSFREFPRLISKLMRKRKLP